MLLLRILLPAALAATLSAQTDWPVYGHDAGGLRYSPLKQINPANVSKLQRAWTYHTGELPPPKTEDSPRAIAFEATPLMIGNTLYVSTQSNRVIALDPATGREIWIFDPHAKWQGKPGIRAHRGVAYWPGDKSTPPRILFGTLDARLIALNAKTGKPIPGFGKEGEVNLRAGVGDKFPDSIYGVTSPPAIYRDLVITGSEVPEGPGLGPSGDVRAWDVRSGKMVWQFHTVPQPGEPGHETWEGDGWKNRTGVNTWSIMTVDAERGMIFLPIGSPAFDFYGGDRKGQNLYGNCLVALEARTGKLLWYYQFVHHDVWDYDPPAPPALITVHRDGRDIPAVVEVTKMGLVFILDRLTGKPLYPVEEQAVPKSDVPGEATWPTQPVPLKPPPLSRSSVTRDDISDVTPETHKFCMDLFNQLENHGRYTPFGTKPTLVLPGTLGGATWSGVSFDPALGYIFVNANETGAQGWMEEMPKGSPIRYRRTSSAGGYARFWDPNLWPCVKPPWGTLTAINVNTGEIAWRVPLGIVEALEAKGVHNTGTSNIGGGIATAGGLVFIAATNDRRFRAFDSRTGRVLWTAEIDGSGHATPMTFQGRDGKQYVVIAAGGGGQFGSSPSDALIAFTLGETKEP
ncbi:MAG TPA: pyrroloquinoline quinone-dependent dehydrogenase [Bryobacteraceae bacterium]|nr:pyrroloquinoline quinone-dependent dehydrogenase [Bryobacteraceae bacterium]